MGKKLDPFDVATTSVVVDDPREWLEMSVRTWEADIHAAGWDQPPRLGCVVAVPPPQLGLGLAQLPVPEDIMRYPELLLEEMAKQHAGRLRRVMLPGQWRSAGWEPVALALCAEVWTAPLNSLDLSVFRSDQLSEHPNRGEQRRVVLVGPDPEHSFTLDRTRDGGPPTFSAGVAPQWEGPDRPESTAMEDNLRIIARKVVPRKFGGDWK